MSSEIENATESSEQVSDEELRKKLDAEQYHVLREKGTERAFTGKYWDLKDAGMYRCAACGEPSARLSRASAVFVFLCCTREVTVASGANMVASGAFAAGRLWRLMGVSFIKKESPEPGANQRGTFSANSPREII